MTMRTFLLQGVLLASAAHVAAQNTLELNGSLARQTMTRTSVHSTLIGSSGDHLAYLADQDTAGTRELYGVPIDGSAGPVKLSPPLEANQRLGYLPVISADGSRVAFTVVGSEPASTPTASIWSAPTDGSSPAVQLTSEITIAEFSELQLSLDGTRLVYSEIDTSLALSSVPSDGSQAATILHSGSLVWRPRISADGTRVVFLESGGGTDQLLSVPIDGSASAVQLNGVLVPGGKVEAFLISADSAWVVYGADQDTDDVFELFSVPIDGSASALRLNASLVMGGDAGLSQFADGGFRITNKGTRVVYMADQAVDDVNELFQVPIDGSAAPVRLSGSLVPNGDVARFEITPDDRYVVILGDLASDEVVELFLVPTAGGVSPMRLNEPLVSGGDVQVFATAPDSRSVFYKADQRIDQHEELFSVPLGKIRSAVGPRSVRLSLASVPGGSVSSIAFDARRVVYDGVHTGSYFSVPTDGGPTVALTPAEDYSFSLVLAPGGYAVWQDLQPNGSSNLFSAQSDGTTPAVQLNDPLPMARQ